MTDKSYTISEIASVADVTTRTIRYYVSESLLPPPEGGGRAATYTQEHLDRLKLIKILKDEYLPLQEIRLLLAGLDHRAVIELLAEKQKSEVPPPAPNSAKAYLQTLLNPPEEADQAPMLMRHRVEAQRQSKKKERSGRAPETEVGQRTEFEIRESRNSYQGVDSRPASENAALTGPAKHQAPVTHWRRIPLTPDVELHVREEAKIGNLWSKIERLIEIARQILSIII